MLLYFLLLLRVISWFKSQKCMIKPFHTDRSGILICIRFPLKTGFRYPAEVSMDRIRIGYPARYLQFFRVRIGFGYLFLKQIGSGQDQDICLISITKFSWECFKMSQMMVLLFSLLWFLYSQKIKMIWSGCAALITIDDNSCYFIVNTVVSGEVEEVSCSYIAGMLLSFVFVLISLYC